MIRFHKIKLGRRFTTLVGTLLFVALMVAGYYYNITFVQLGLIDLGIRLVGMSETAVSTWMAALALCTLLVAVATGVAMDRRGWSTDLRTKLRILFGVVLLQFLLTLVAPSIRTVPGFGAWIVGGFLGATLGTYRPVDVPSGPQLAVFVSDGQVGEVETLLRNHGTTAVEDAVTHHEHPWRIGPDR